MTLTFENFEKCAEEFLNLSSTMGDQWIKKTIDPAKKNFYLEKRCIVHYEKSDNSENINNTVASSCFSITTFVYHIIYSESYSVPVLYFNAYHEDGSLLTLDEIWNKIPDCFQDGAAKNKWHVITQMEHPKLGIPYFMIHPCYTADFMRCCSSSNYLISWLSTVGPLVGIHLSIDYANHIHQ